MKFSIDIIFRKLFLFIILFLIIHNFWVQLPSFRISLHHFKSRQKLILGREFVPLIPFLKGVSWAGYKTCLNSSHPLTDADLMGPYQQAQFILVPTVVDYYHPFDYRYLIVQCPDINLLRKIQGQLSSRGAVRIFDGVLLLDRKRNL